MKKKKFKKLMKKENNEFKNYYVYERIVIILLVLLSVLNIILNFNEIIPLNIFIINSLLTLIIIVPLIIIDLLNDFEINKIYNQHKKDKKIPEYKSKTKILKIMIVVSIVITIIESTIIIRHICSNKLPEIENKSEITSNRGNTIETQYENFGGFALKIPKDFKIMSEEAIKIKYPAGNLPSLIYTNERGTINVVLVMNEVSVKNTQIEEYTKLMESIYKEYSKDIKIDFWERNNHKIGELKFTTQATDTEIYNHVIIFSVADKLRLVNFNCTKELIGEWEEIGNFIINSIKFD